MAHLTLTRSRVAGQALDWPYWDGYYYAAYSYGSSHTVISYTASADTPGHTYGMQPWMTQATGGPNATPQKYEPRPIGAVGLCVATDGSAPAGMDRAIHAPICYVEPSCPDPLAETVMQHLSYADLASPPIYCHGWLHAAIACTMSGAHDFLTTPTAITVDRYQQAAISGAQSATELGARLSPVGHSYFPPHREPSDSRFPLAGYQMPPYMAHPTWSQNLIYEAQGSPTGIRHYVAAFSGIFPGAWPNVQGTTYLGGPRCIYGIWDIQSPIIWPSSIPPPSAVRCFIHWVPDPSLSSGYVYSYRTVLRVSGRDASGAEVQADTVAVAGYYGIASISPTWLSGAESYGAITIQLIPQMQPVLGIDGATGLPILGEWGPATIYDGADVVLLPSIDPGQWPLYVPPDACAGTAYVPGHMSAERPYSAPHP